MYKIKLAYPTFKQHVPSQEYKESITYSVCIGLYIDHNIDCYQTSASVIEFETDAQRSLALLKLSVDKRFSVHCI